MARYGFRAEPSSMKTFILFAMSRCAERVTLDELSEMVLIDDNMDYFMYSEMVGALVQSEHLRMEKNRDGKDVYTITSRGRLIAEYSESSLPYALKRAAKGFIETVSERVERNACLETEVFCEGNEPLARLRMTDGFATMMCLEIIAGTEEDAGKICANFRAHAEAIFKEIAATVRQKF